MLKKSGRYESCDKRSCQVSDFMAPFSTETGCENFKIQGGPFNCNSQKINSPLKVEICGEALYIDKRKMKFRARFTYYKSAL